MSYAAILALFPGKDDPPEELKELRNAWGAAPVIWDALCQKYCGAKPLRWHDHLDQLWPRHVDLSLPEYTRAVLMMTFDFAYVRKAHFARAAKDIRRYLKECPNVDGRVNHWPTIAAFYESDPDAEAIGIYQTSVSENPFAPAWYEDAAGEEICEPFDWGQTYEIYDSLDALAGLKNE